MNRESGQLVRGWKSAPTVALFGLYVFTAFALVGYATFGLRPALLANHPQLVGFYAISFQFFAQAQVWLAGLAIGLFLWKVVGWQWLPAFGALYLISLGSELMGTTVGLPFGEYRYTSALGPQWFGHVPILIPLSWFFMALPSYAVARAMVPGGADGRVTGGRAIGARVLIASLLLLSWDLALDPAMSHATAYWVWAEPGTYYGMPWLNLFGWYVTGILLMIALVFTRSDVWIEKLPLPWLVAFYGANLLLPVGMSVAAGLWGAVAATMGALGAVALVAPVLGWQGWRREGALEVSA
jgi:uncharacterized membrane protein